MSDGEEYASERRGPAGWPRSVPPAGVPGWERSAVSWLLDQCPAEYRSYELLRRHPYALAWLADAHVRAQLQAARECYASARVELGERLGPHTTADMLEVVHAEGLRLRAAARSVSLLRDVLAVTGEGPQR